MKKLPFVIVIIIALGVGFAVGWFGSPRPSSSVLEKRIIIDTITDTIKHTYPVPIDSVVIRYIPVKLPKTDSIGIKEKDTLKVDSIYVELPIQQKEYKDSTYHAWVSGFNVNLDSINVYKHTVTVTERFHERPKRWGIGLQLGAGYNGDKVRPYIGIGISYNILMW